MDSHDLLSPCLELERPSPPVRFRQHSVLLSFQNLPSLWVSQYRAKRKQVDVVLVCGTQRSHLRIGYHIRQVRRTLFSLEIPQCLTSRRLVNLKDNANAIQDYDQRFNVTGMEEKPNAYFSHTSGMLLDHLGFVYLKYQPLHRSYGRLSW